MDATKKVTGRFEPVWQFIMSDVTPVVAADFLEYLNANPMNGYYIHVYEDQINANAVKIYGD